MGRLVGHGECSGQERRAWIELLTMKNIFYIILFILIVSPQLALASLRSDCSNFASDISDGDLQEYYNFARQATYKPPSLCEHGTHIPKAQDTHRAAYAFKEQCETTNNAVLITTLTCVKQTDQATVFTKCEVAGQVLEPCLTGNLYKMFPPQ